jgi:hypothetical protein
VCGGGRRHGGRLGLGCIVQHVRALEVLVAFVSFLSLWVLVSVSGRGVILAPFLPFHSCVASHEAICSGCFPVALCVAALGAAGVVCGGGRRHGGRFGLGCIVQRVRGFRELVACVSFLCLWFFFLWLCRQIGTLSSVPPLSCFSRGDWFWLLSRCFVRCGVGRGGRGVWRRAAARLASWSWLHRLASAWLRSVGCFLCLFCACGCWFLSLAVASYWLPFFRSILELLLTRRFVLVAFPLFCALRRWARRA